MVMVMVIVIVIVIASCTRAHVHARDVMMCTTHVGDEFGAGVDEEGVESGPGMHAVRDASGRLV